MSEVTAKVPIRLEALRSRLSRKKVVKVSHHLLCSILNGACRLKEHMALPEDAFVSGAHLDYMTDSLVFVVCSEAWPEVAAGELPQVLRHLDLFDLEMKP